ncbi:MFS transporter [Bacillus sp. LL01]|uniref:MFS transporter n=1 Tax=Bacillus sp. LL01 TaxID=1665556 RepID=UPI00064D0D5C|nr:MFS transporter [Bacillus sp. LL01]KMJ57623.1 MFS transporter [Bacillus sp. LL01]
MNSLYRDSRFRFIIFANIASSIGSGITMIAIPWLLVTSRNGNEVFGYVAMGMTIINFILTPYLGHLIDRISRKRLLICSKVVSLFALLAFTAIGFLGVDYELWHYIVIYMIGSLYYTIFYPTMFALNQELFRKDQFKVLNGTMEVQGQLSSMVAGGIASILLLKWELHYILLMDVCTYAVAIFFFMKIPYVREKREATDGDGFGTSKVTGIKASVTLNYLMKQPVMFLFLLATSLPFIAIMLTNYLFPVYLADVLSVEGNIYGIQGMVYGLGAVLAGVFVPIAAQKFAGEKMIAALMVMFTVAISIMVYLSVSGYLFMMLLIAVGNSGVRVARNTFMMEHVPNDIIGRVDGLLRATGLLLRIVLLGLFTGLVSGGHILLCFTILTGILGFASFYVVVYWRRSLHSINREVVKA